MFNEINGSDIHFPEHPQSSRQLLTNARPDVHDLHRLMERNIGIGHKKYSSAAACGVRPSLSQCVPVNFIVEMIGFEIPLQVRIPVFLWTIFFVSPGTLWHQKPQP